MTGKEAEAGTRIETRTNTLIVDRDSGRNS